MSASIPGVVQVQLWTRARDVWNASESSRTSQSSRGPSQRDAASCPSEVITSVSSGLSGASSFQEKQNNWRSRQARRKESMRSCVSSKRSCRESWRPANFDVDEIPRITWHPLSPSGKVVLWARGVPHTGARESHLTPVEHGLNNLCPSTPSNRTNVVKVVDRRASMHSCMQTHFTSRSLRTKWVQPNTDARVLKTKRRESVGLPATWCFHRASVRLIVHTLACMHSTTDDHIGTSAA